MGRHNYINLSLKVEGNLELDIVSGSVMGHETPVFEALSKRINYRRDSQSSVAGPPNCASVALRRRLAQLDLTILVGPTFVMLAQRY